MIKTILIETNPKDLEILTSKSEPIASEDIASEETKNLIQDMTDTLKNESNGAGLAANQIGELKQVFITKHGVRINIFINPEIVRGWGRVTGREGCLSRPAVRPDRPAPSVLVERFKAVTVRWTDITGKTLTRKFTGKQAIYIQHEFDHFDGKLI